MIRFCKDWESNLVEVGIQGLHASDEEERGDEEQQCESENEVVEPIPPWLHEEQLEASHNTHFRWVGQWCKDRKCLNIGGNYDGCEAGHARFVKLTQLACHNAEILQCEQR